jgi:hypothetical protein
MARASFKGSRQVAYTNNTRNRALDPPQICSIECRLKDMATQWVDMQVYRFFLFLCYRSRSSLELPEDKTTRSQKRFKSILIALALANLRCKTLRCVRELNAGSRFAFAAQKFATSTVRIWMTRAFPFYVSCSNRIAVFIHLKRVGSRSAGSLPSPER